MNQTLGISCHTFSAKTSLSRLIDGPDISAKWTSGLRISSVILVLGGTGQLSYAAIGAHARSFVAKRVDHHSGCVALMWDAVGEVGAASCTEVEASHAELPRRAPIAGTRTIF